MKKNLVLAYAVLMTLFSVNAARAKTTLVYFDAETRAALPAEKVSELYPLLREITGQTDIFRGRLHVDFEKMCKRGKKCKGIEIHFSTPKPLPFTIKTKTETKTMTMTKELKANSITLLFCPEFVPERARKNNIFDFQENKKSPDSTLVCDNAIFAISYGESKALLAFSKNKAGAYAKQIEELIEKQKREFIKAQSQNPFEK
ncbi:MAG: hypothetical protein J5787_04835 [Alphaproteobacteria bacterium]|nr:hypothetical protein [Alphaproteobacteria bacterium]